MLNLNIAHFIHGFLSPLEPFENVGIGPFFVHFPLDQPFGIPVTNICPNRITNAVRKTWVKGGGMIIDETF